MWGPEGRSEIAFPENAVERSGDRTGELGNASWPLPLLGSTLPEFFKHDPVQESAADRTCDLLLNFRRKAAGLQPSTGCIRILAVINLASKSK